MIDARHPGAFPDLAPPPGGLARLRARVDGADRVDGRRARVLTLAFVPALAAAAFAFVLVTDAPVALPDHPSLAAPTTGAAGVAGAIAVPLGEKVTMYWVP